jgi:hypothetical protein
MLVWSPFFHSLFDLVKESGFHGLVQVATIPCSESAHYVFHNDRVLGNGISRMRNTKSNAPSIIFPPHHNPILMRISLNPKQKPQKMKKESIQTYALDPNATAKTCIIWKSLNENCSRITLGSQTREAVRAAPKMAPVPAA